MFVLAVNHLEQREKMTPEERERHDRLTAGFVGGMAGAFKYGVTGGAIAGPFGAVAGVIAGAIHGATTCHENPDKALPMLVSSSFSACIPKK